jgi:type IV pilus assembly protein PilW
MWALAQGGGSTSITLDADASSTDDFYTGVLIRIIDGTGAGQSRTITSYTGDTGSPATSNIATVDSEWAITPDNSSVYAFGLGYVLGTSGYIFNQRDCATSANKRKFVSNIYYVRNYAVNPGDGIPTLVQSTFDLAGGKLEHQPAQALIEGIEGFRVLYGIDSYSKGNTPENYTNPVAWVNPYNKVTPTNRGDGVPEGTYVNAAGLTCNGATSGPLSGTYTDTCPASNVVAARIYVLARSLETTQGYTDTKTYQLGDISMGPFNDGFKRHVYSTTARLVNPASRRDTP